ncbi:hypothetical protein AB0420_34180 [Streptomyces caelestis]|uniref:hypothetical protein n=1 Tax=Streptomyces TaxID=1883 RepID=UPI000B110C06|nr:hypothetical protein [Streptomyces sp. XY152]
MTRMTVTNTYMAAVAVAVALAGAPGVAQAVTPAQAPGVAHAHHRISEPASSTAGAVRVVAPGERVRAGAGVELWLTEEGKHWSTPEMEHQFRSVVDGNIDLRSPGIGLMAETVGDRCFLSGIHVTGHRSVRVVVDTSDGAVTASVVRLPGAPGWGVWYADVPLHEDLTVDGVTLYDKRGKEIASPTPSRP